MKVVHRGSKCSFLNDKLVNIMNNPALETLKELRELYVKSKNVTKDAET